MSKHILFVVNGFNLGGIETYIDRFLEYNDIYHITILSKTGRGGYFEDKYISLNAKIFKMKIGYFDLIGQIKFYLHLNKYKYHAICDFTGTFSGPFLFIAKFASIKNRIGFFRGSRYQFQTSFLKTQYLQFSKYLLLKSATKILSNSEAAFDYFLPQWRNDSRKYHIIFNGISPSENNSIKYNRDAYNIPEDAFVIGHIGNFRKAKNHKFILQLANRICNKYPNVYFLLFGNGVQEGLNNLIQKQGLETKIICPGICRDSFKAHTLMDLFLFPSLNEGQPNALLEAMLSGLPIVASKIPAIVECTHPDMSDVLISLDDLDNFESTIIQILMNSSGYNLVKIKEWTEKIFNAKKNFELFSNFLEN